MVLKYNEILCLVDEIDPISYSRNRNYSDGSVSRLSLYISRGVISTKLIAERLLEHHSFQDAEKFIQELTWRDHWQRQWLMYENIDESLLTEQQNKNSGIPNVILNASTGIHSIDKGIETLYTTGYIHNHMRMYLASLHCNIAKSDWLSGARWMYYHLLDGDWASNALSWQWVAGTNSKKKYYFNQENLNKYFYSNQQSTFIDKTYPELTDIPVPEELQKMIKKEYTTELPPSSIPPIIKEEISINIYNYYNLDPLWESESDKKILLLEPSIFDRYPISEKSLKFALDLFNSNIKEGEIFIGEFESLKSSFPNAIFKFKEHPLNKYTGIESARDWLAPAASAENSFFKYWKNVKRENNWTGKR